MKTQDTHAQNTTEQTTNQTTNQEQTSLGVVSTAGALSLLFNKAVDHLDNNELKHIAAMSNLATSELNNLEDGVLALGLLLNSNEDKYELDGTTMANVLFGLSHQMNTIGGLLFVAGEARFKIEQLKDGAK